MKNGTFVPISCLELLPGLSIPPTKLTGDQAAEMIKQTAIRPEDRKKAIDIVRVENDFNRNARLGAWDISVSTEMAPLGKLSFSLHLHFFHNTVLSCFFF